MQTNKTNNPFGAITTHRNIAIVRTEQGYTVVALNKTYKTEAAAKAQITIALNKGKISNAQSRTAIADNLTVSFTIPFGLKREKITLNDVTITKIFSNGNQVTKDQITSDSQHVIDCAILDSLYDDRIALYNSITPAVYNLAKQEKNKQ